MNSVERQVSRPTLVVENEPSVGGLTLPERRLRDSAKYINKRIANMHGAEVWLDVGRELAELKEFLVKHHKGDNTASGWLVAFKRDTTPFAFGRRHADKLIQIHSTIGGHAWPPKNLPASVAALLELSRVPPSHREAVIACCSPGSTATEVKRYAREQGAAPRKKKRKRRDPIEAAHNKHVECLQTLTVEQKVDEILKFAADLGIEHLITRGEAGR